MKSYIFFLIIPLFFIIPSAYGETFVWTNGADVGAFTGGPNAGGVACPDTTHGTAAAGTIYQDRSGSSSNCSNTIFRWDISTIPDTATIDAVNFRINIDTDHAESNENCAIRAVLSEDPNTATDTNNYREAINGTTYTSSVDCDNAPLTQATYSLGATAVADLQAQLASDWFAIGMHQDPHTRTASFQSMTYSDAQLEIKYTGDPQTDTVSGLTSTGIGGQHVTLSFTAPSAPGGTIIGYMINITNPWNENVASIARNNTNLDMTSYTVNQLNGETQYSFRVGYWIDGTCHAGCAGNPNSNILNVTTIQDETMGFTPGTFNFTASGTDLRDIRFEEIRINDDDIRLNVTYPTTFANLKCDIDYLTLQQNRTYSGLTAIPAEAGYEEISFRFNNVTNVGEVITTYCWNNQEGNGTYLITQKTVNIPFVNQIKLFQGGEFGTAGDFGAIDLVTLLLFGVVATMGFNSKNEAVGAVFLIGLTFGLAYFELITIPTLFGGVFAAIVMVVVMQVRKD